LIGIILLSTVYGIRCLAKELLPVSTGTDQTRKLLIPSVTDYVQLQNCTPNHVITLSPNDRAQEVASFRVGRTQDVFCTPAIAFTYVLIRTYCTYWNKAGYLHKLQSQLAAVLQVLA